MILALNFILTFFFDKNFILTNTGCCCILFSLFHCLSNLDERRKNSDNNSLLNCSSLQINLPEKFDEYSENWSIKSQKCFASQNFTWG